MPPFERIAFHASLKKTPTTIDPTPIISSIARRLEERAMRLETLERLPSRLPRPVNPVPPLPFTTTRPNPSALKKHIPIARPLFGPRPRLAELAKNSRLPVRPASVKSCYDFPALPQMIKRLEQAAARPRPMVAGHTIAPALETGGDRSRRRHSYLWKPVREAQQTWELRRLGRSPGFYTRKMVAKLQAKVSRLPRPLPSLQKYVIH